MIINIIKQAKEYSCKCESEARFSLVSIHMQQFIGNFLQKCIFSSSVMSLGIIATEQNAGFVKHFELCGEQKLLGK